MSNTSRAIERIDYLESLSEGLKLALAHHQSRGPRGPLDLEWGEARRAIKDAMLEFLKQADAVWPERGA